jgi:hypothetical protein
LLPVRARRFIRGVITLWQGGTAIPGPLAYHTDGLFTRHSADFLSEPRFAAAYAAGVATGSWDGIEPLQWRTKVVCDLAAHCATLEGDFVECGVNKGGFAAAICQYLDFGTVDKRMYLLDTFAGFDPSLLTPDEAARNVEHYAAYSECYEQVCDTFAPFTNVEIVRGAVPGTLRHVRSEKIAYLSIDMNCVIPEIAAAEHFWDRLVPGAVIVLDDYGFAAHRAQKDAFDEFARRHGVAVLPLPTGQGLIFKPHAEVARKSAHPATPAVEVPTPSRTLVAA